MKKRKWSDTVRCPEDECEHEINAEFYPGYPSKTYGRPEDCYPAEPTTMDVEFAECPGCGREFTDEDFDRWIEEYEERGSE